MKIASWNTYGLPTSTLMSLDADINAGKFDVVCMQETHGHEQARKADRTLDAGADLESDHPGFNDQTYRARRAELATVAQEYVWNEPIPMIDYTPDEIATWGAVWDRMEDLLQKHACVEYKKSYESMKEHCGYSRTSIPQQQVRWREGECVCCVLFSP